MTMFNNPIHYLEIVTTDVDAMCAQYTMAAGLQFGERIPELGEARTALLPSGTVIGIRLPIHEPEKPAVRTYLRVANLEESVKQAAEAGANIILGNFEIQGHGLIAIYEFGGIQQGLWQVI